MEGTPHTSRRSTQIPPPPAEPKPNPPRPPSGKRNKRAKNSQAEPSSITPVNTKQNQPIEYRITGMLMGRERFPEDIKQMLVTLSQPAPDDECPIALEAISTAELSFLPGCSFFKDKPDYTKLTLPCGHSFSAMILIYNWCKSNMLCPCCRQGLDRRANANYLPTHFREQIKTQLRTTLTAERMEEEHDTIQAILEMTPMTMAFTDLADRGCLEMTIAFFFRPARDNTASQDAQISSSGHFSMIVRLTTQMERRGDSAPRGVFRPSRQNMTVLRQTPSDVQAINVTTQMRILGAGVVNIDNSGEIDFPEPLPGPPSATGNLELSHTPLIVRRATGYRRTGQQGQPSALPVVPVSTFEFTFGQRERSVFLDNVAWIPDSTHVGVTVDRD